MNTKYNKRKERKHKNIKQNKNINIRYLRKDSKIRKRSNKDTTKSKLQQQENQ